MSSRKMIVEVPSETFDKFKMECAKNHTTIKDEVFKLICAALDGVEVTAIRKAEPSEESFEKELSEPIKEDLDAKIKPILGMIEGLTSVTKELQQWRDEFRVWQDGKFDALDAHVLAFDGKMKIVSNFLENHIYLFMKTSGANPCAEDIEGLAILRNEEVPSTKGLDKPQLKELFVKGMRTKVF